MSKVSKRIYREFRAEIKAFAKEIFPLLCPVREYDWIPQWRCDLLYSESGVAELGCVFATDFGDGYGRETWVVSKYKPEEKIEFIRTGLKRTTRYEIILIPHDARTILLWRQEITGLDAKGNELVEEYSDEVFAAIMNPLNKMLAHYLEFGTPLNLDLSKLLQSNKV